MLFKEIIAVYSKNHMKHTIQKEEILTAEASGTYNIQLPLVSERLKQSDQAI
jgi:hypothetical protein